MPANRVILDAPPFPEAQKADLMQRGVWPASWVRLAGDPAPPFVSAYRLKIKGAVSTRLHIAADERYVLFVDGERVGRGNDRGHLDRWFFDSYDLELGPGPHELFAWVWSLGEGAPYAQMSLAPGFLVADEGGALSTGKADWEGAKLDGISFLDPLAAWGSGAKMRFEGEPTGPWGLGRPAEWAPVEVVEAAREIRGANDIGPTRLLAPSMLPAQYEAALEGVEIVHVSAPPEGETSGIPFRAEDHLPGEVAAWEAVLRGEGEPVVVPPGQRRRVLVRFPTYACVYPRVRASGSAGARVRVHVQEALYENLETWSKGDRLETEGKFFTTVWSGRDGIGDEFGPRGFKQDFGSLWWVSGRYAEILVESGARTTAVFAVGFDETRYPLDLGGWPKVDDPRLQSILDLCRRGLEVCAHETFIDCGYEQLQYVLDARIEGLLALVFGEDDRLVRKALVLFADSILPTGQIESRYPSRVRQVIPPFSLSFVGMVHDYATWRGDRAFVRSLMPTVRRILDAFAALEDERGILATPDGWNFVDWVPGWEGGMPPGLDDAPNPFLGLLLRRARREAGELARILDGTTPAPEDPVPEWIAAHADGPLGRTEQYAALMLEEPYENRPKGMIQKMGPRLAGLDGEISRATFAFLHDVFPILSRFVPRPSLKERIEAGWGPLVDHHLATTIEMPEPTRSDAHGWGGSRRLRRGDAPLEVRSGLPASGSLLDLRCLQREPHLARDDAPHPLRPAPAPHARRGLRGPSHRGHPARGTEVHRWRFGARPRGRAGRVPRPPGARPLRPRHERPEPLDQRACRGRTDGVGKRAAPRRRRPSPPRPGGRRGSLPLVAPTPWRADASARNPIAGRARLSP